jgi:putative addiction module killer protein
VEAAANQVKYYRKSNGVIPFLNWFDSLKDDTVKSKIRTRLDRVKLGNLGDYRSVAGGVFELRFDMGPGYRIYFSREGNALVILYCGGDKSSQSKNVVLAQEFLTDYRRRAR